MHTDHEIIEYLEAALPNLRREWAEATANVIHAEAELAEAKARLASTN